MIRFILYLVLILSFVSLCLAFCILGERRPLQNSIKNVFNTAIFWSIINVLACYSNIKLPLSLVSLSVSVFCGIPGVVLLILLKAVF